jgi:corrinoid protein of di/trimethylamine methyltransferase
MSRKEEILDGLYEHTLDGEAESVRALVQEGLELGIEPLEMLFEALIPALEEVGRLFEQGEYFVPEMLIAARAMQGAMNILKPLLASNANVQIGTFIMATVKGDIHDIGKNLCNIMLEGAGFKVIDLGVNCPPEKYIQAVIEHKAELVGMSAFLTTTMPMFKKNVEAFKEAGIRDKVKILVGGAPVTQEYCDVVGADGYAPDASSCVRLAKQLLAQLREKQAV